MDSYLKEKLDKLKAFARESKVRTDWHEPDEQDVTAVVTGVGLDNAMGEHQKGIEPQYQELVVHLYRDGSHKMSINLATLLAIACSDAEPLGMKVALKFSEDGHFDGAAVLRNVTEIHYRYPTNLGQRVAFESDIHGTGITYDIDNIDEFEVRVETEKADEF